MRATFWYCYMPFLQNDFGLKEKLQMHLKSILWTPYGDTSPITICYFWTPDAPSGIRVQSDLWNLNFRSKIWIPNSIFIKNSNYHNSSLTILGINTPGHSICAYTPFERSISKGGSVGRTLNQTQFTRMRRPDWNSPVQTRLYQISTASQRIQANTNLFLKFKMNFLIFPVDHFVIFHLFSCDEARWVIWDEQSGMSNLAFDASSFV